jgi:hypothetical protein
VGLSELNHLVIKQLVSVSECVVARAAAKPTKVARGCKKSIGHLIKQLASVSECVVARAAPKPPEVARGCQSLIGYSSSD